MPAPIQGIRVVPVGDLPRHLVERILAALSRRLSVPCRLAPASARVSPRALPQRQQFDADDLLEQLEALAEDGDDVVLGLTPHDIGNPVFTFFFGRARRPGRAALVSLARLVPDFYGLPADDDLAAHRAALEILHELGHVAGLKHCDDFGCLMRFCTDVESIDNRAATFCTPCSALLPPAFDPVRRR